MLTQQSPDLLYTIFEQQLFDFQDENEDQPTFITRTVDRYVSEVRRLGLIIPSEWEKAVKEEIYHLVQQMLLKKMYGCLSINEFRQKQVQPKKRRAKSRSSMTG